MSSLPSLLCLMALLGPACVVGCGSDAAPAQPSAAALGLGARAEVASPAASAPAYPSVGSSCPARPAREVKLSRDVEPILVSGCSGQYCHGMAMSSASRAYAFLVNQPSNECDDLRPLVTPGDPDRSYVLDKITDRNLCAGHPMPRGLENRLSASEVDTLRDWICEGAPND